MYVKLATISLATTTNVFVARPTASRFTDWVETLSLDVPHYQMTNLSTVDHATLQCSMVT